MGVPDGVGRAVLPDDAGSRGHAGLSGLAGWAPGNSEEALAAVQAGLHWLAHADAGALPGEIQADCLRGLGRAESV
jgi:hypothetical protein